MPPKMHVVGVGMIGFSLFLEVRVERVLGAACINTATSK